MSSPQALAPEFQALAAKAVLSVLVAKRSEASHFAGGLVLNASEISARHSRDFDLFHEAETEVAYASEADITLLRAAGGNDIGYRPMLLLEMMRRFARLNPRQLETIDARNVDPSELKRKWLVMSERAEAEITLLADAQPALPIGVAFVDSAGRPIWPSANASVTIHSPTIRGCWPKMV